MGLQIHPVACAPFSTGGDEDILLGQILQIVCWSCFRYAGDGYVFCGTGYFSMRIA